MKVKDRGFERRNAGGSGSDGGERGRGQEREQRETAREKVCLTLKREQQLKKKKAVTKPEKKTGK